MENLIPALPELTRCANGHDKGVQGKGKYCAQCVRDYKLVLDAQKAKRKRETARKRHRVFARDGYRCINCGSSRNLTLDHVWPRAKGGTSDEGNLQTLCYRCNQLKGDSEGLPVVVEEGELDEQAE